MQESWYVQDYFLCRTPYMPIDDFPKPSELRIGSDFFDRVGTLFMIIQPQLIADPNRRDDYIGSSPCFSLSENLPYVPLRIVRSFGADDKTSCLLATVYSLIPKYVVCCIALGCSVYSYGKRLDQICCILTRWFTSIAGLRQARRPSNGATTD